MDQLIVFPQPQRLETLKGSLRLASKAGAVTCCAEVPPESGFVAEAVRVLDAAVKKHGVRLQRVTAAPDAKLVLRLSDQVSQEEGYVIDAAGRQVVVTARTGKGLLHAAHTLRQVLRLVGRSLVMPRLRIQDWPSLPFRGLFQESTFSSSAMTLQDWKEMVDELAELKLNVLMVSLYGCWARQDHTKEFIFVPSRKHPNLVTPVKEEYYSPSRKRHVRREVLPVIFEQDFYGEVVRYGRERGVTVVPFVNSLGHNSLIPRLYPETAARDPQGRIQPEGFCTSSRRTYKILFDLFDEIIERYSKPYGIEMFSIGYDEVRWACHCSKCRRAGKTAGDNFLVRHLVRCLEHLKSRGVKRVLLFHDMIDRMGLLNRTLERTLRRKKLHDLPALLWWHYADFGKQPPLFPNRGRLPLSFRPQFGLANWATPSAGWNYMMPLPISQPGKVGSIITHAQVAERDGAEGMISYSSYDTCFFMGMRALSEYSWNLRPTNDPRAFDERFARAVFGAGWPEGLQTIQRMEAAATWEPLFENMFSRTRLKTEPGIALFKLDKALYHQDVFENAVRTLEDCAARFRTLAARRPAYAAVIRCYAADCEYARAVLDVSLGTLLCLRRYHDARFEPTRRELAQRFAEAIADYDKRVAGYLRAMAGIEKFRYRPSVPSVLNRMTLLYDFAQTFRTMCLRLRQELRKGDAGTLPLFDYPLDCFLFEALGLKIL